MTLWNVVGRLSGKVALSFPTEDQAQEYVETLGLGYAFRVEGPNG